MVGPNAGIAGDTNLNARIFAKYPIVAREFIGISDERMKNIDKLSNSKQDLEILGKIEATDYHMIDPSIQKNPFRKVFRGNSKKFILRLFQNRNTALLSFINWPIVRQK